MHDTAIQTQFTYRGNHIVRRGGVLGFLESLRSLVCVLFDIMSDGDQDFILEIVDELILELSEKIEGLLEVRDLNNAPTTVKVPPVLPNQLIGPQPWNVYDWCKNRNRNLKFA